MKATQTKIIVLAATVALGFAGAVIPASAADASVGSHYVRLSSSSSAKSLLVDPGHGHAKVVIHRGQKTWGTEWNSRVWVGKGYEVCDLGGWSWNPAGCEKGPRWVPGGYGPGTYTVPIHRS